jgi:hypothetical protein
LNENTWQCPHCDAQNPASQVFCRQCNEQRPIDIVGGGGAAIKLIDLLRPKEQ